MALNIYEPMKFRSQGIEDLATRETLVISNGKITVDIVESKQTLNFADSNFAGLEGKGIRWTDGNRSKSLTYKSGNIASDLSINLAEEQEYKINDVSVLSVNTLGSSVIKSKLREVGILRSLRVAGSATFGDFAFINSEINRIGINTDNPAGALGVKENGVDIVIGSNKTKTAQIGTASHDDLEIVTDRQVRISVGRNGDIVIGDVKTENGIVRINGKLYASEVITERTSPVIFKEENGDTVYGKGLIWKLGRGPNRQLIFQGNPDRLWSTDIFDLAAEKYYSIENTMVLSKGSLGPTVTDSNLTSLGVLKDLQVAGDAAVTRRISTSRLEIGRFAVDENRLESQRSFCVTVDGTEELKLGSSIVIGNSTNPTRVVSVYGRLSVGATNPDPDIVFTVDGTVMMNGKKFLQAARQPENGSFNKGDIVWNTDPKAGDYIGWVCVTTGTPGAWLPFGGISSR